jgi:hypothetical protein
LGIITGFMAVSTVRLVRRRDARLAGFQVRRAGHLNRTGRFAMMAITLWFTFVVHSFLVQRLRYHGLAALSLVDISWEQSASPRWKFANASDGDQKRILLARASLEKANNFGIFAWSDVKVGLAWIAALHGDREMAADYLRTAIKLNPQSEELREMLNELGF